MKGVTATGIKKVLLGLIASALAFFLSEAAIGKWFDSTVEANLELKLVISDSCSVSAIHGHAMDKLEEPHFMKLDKKDTVSLEYQIDNLEEWRYNFFRFNKTDLKITLLEVQLKGKGFELAWSGQELQDYFRISNRDLTKGKALASGRSLVPIVLNTRPGFRDGIDEVTRWGSLPVSITMAVLIFGVVLFMMKWGAGWSFYQVILLGGFGLILVIPNLLPDEFESQENRSLTERPKLSLEEANRFPSRYSRYLNDRFSLRTELIQLNNILKIDLFNSSPVPSAVLIGENDFLFCSAEDVRESSDGVTLYTNQELNKIKDRLELRAEWCKSQGSDYYLMISPMKHAIYPEMLPAMLKKRGPINKIEQLLEYLRKESSLDIIDVSDELVSQRLKREKPLYYKTDTHWNRLGAFLAYQEIVRCILPEESPRSLTDFEAIWHEEKSGDLSVILSNNKAEYYRDVVFLNPKFDVQAKVDKHIALSDSIALMQPAEAYSVSDTTLNSLMMIRDSYAVYLIPHLSEHFSRSSFYWTRTFYKELVIKEKPDIVVQELLGRFVDTLLEDTSTDH